MRNEATFSSQHWAQREASLLSQQCPKRGPSLSWLHSQPQIPSKGESGPCCPPGPVPATRHLGMGHGFKIFPSASPQTFTDSLALGLHVLYHSGVLMQALLGIPAPC